MMTGLFVCIYVDGDWTRGELPAHAGVTGVATGPVDLQRPVRIHSGEDRWIDITMARVGARETHEGLGTVCVAGLG